MDEPILMHSQTIKLPTRKILSLDVELVHVGHCTLVTSLSYSSGWRPLSPLDVEYDKCSVIVVTTLED